MERRPSEWLKIVKLYVDDGVPMTKLAKKYKFNVSNLKHKIRLYEIHGEKPFTDEQGERIYTREEKLEAIKAVMSGQKSSRQVAAEVGTPDPDTIGEWIRKYKEKGEEGIQVSRGRKKYMLHEDRQKFLADKELKDRCKHLEDENEILKKFLALALLKDKRLKKKYESLMSSRAKSN